jgi:hypothetical protein
MSLSLAVVAVGVWSVAVVVPVGIAQMLVVRTLAVARVLRLL